MGRKKLDRDSLHARVAPQTAEKLKDIAFKLGYIHGGEGSTGQLLDAIATGKVVLLPTDALNSGQSLVVSTAS